MRKFMIAALCASLYGPAYSQSMPPWRSIMTTGNLAYMAWATGTNDSAASWLGKKVDTLGGQATGLVRIGGADSGTDISAAYVDALQSTVSSYIAPKTARARYIFFGGADNFYLTANTSNALINSGKIGLYEHANGIVRLSPAQRTAIQAKFSPTGSQLVTGGGDAMGEIGFTDDPAYVQYFGGRYPAEDNVNIFAKKTNTYTEANGIVYKYYYTKYDLAKFKSNIDYVIPQGTKNIAPVITPNSFDPASIGTDFSADPYWSNLRAAALYTGAIALDTPPTYALWQGQKYITTVISEIRWGLANHLRVTVMVSPYNVTGGGGCAIDPDLWNNTARYLDILVRNGAIPTSYVVQSYCGNGSPNPPTGSTDLSGSMDHLLSMLLTYPVSPPGTAKYQGTVPGTASEADAFKQHTVLSTVGNFFAAPTHTPALADITQTGLGAGVIGSLGYQSADSAYIFSGKIGSSVGASVVNIFLSKTSSFLTQAPLTFQGGGPSGSSVLSGSPPVNSLTGDSFIHLYNPYVPDKSKQGIMFGTTDNGPLFGTTESGSDFMLTNTSLVVKGNSYDYKSAALRNGNNGYVQTWNENMQGETDLITYKGSGVGGMAWYNFNTTNNSLDLLMELIGNDMRLTGKLCLDPDCARYLYENGSSVSVGNTKNGNIFSINDAGEVMSNGRILASEGLQVGNGKNLTLFPMAPGPYPYMTAPDATTIAFRTSAGGDAGIRAWKGTFTGSVSVPDLNVSGAATVSGKFVIPFGTPSSSTAPCTPGQMEMDADYIYSCAASNTWHRASNGATW